MQASAAVAAAAFVVLVVFVIRTLYRIGHSLDRMNSVIDQLQDEGMRVSAEAIVLMKNGQQLTADVHRRFQDCSVWLDAIQQSGQASKQMVNAISRMSKAVGHTADDISKEVHNQQQRISDVLGWVTAGYRLWKER